MEEQGGGEWEIEEQRSDDRDLGKTMSWVLNKGLGLGKKILFAGFVVSSAPVALPSLLVISAIGLVVSIPSGVFLASYALSEKLMSKLLPMPQQQEEEEEEEMEEHRGVKRKIDLFGEEEGLVVEEIVVEMTEEKGEPQVVEAVVVVAGGVEIKKEDDEKEVEIETDNKGLLEKEIREQGKLEGDEDDKISETPPSQASEGDQSGVSPTTTKTTTDKESKDQPGISSDEPAQTNEAKKKKNVKKKPAQQQQQAPRPAQQKVVVYDDEKIWEQIEAVRKIVGYKVTAQKTSLEELKALYYFTGVEPPASFNEPSDLAEVNNNLQFLKSIIGVN